MEKITVLLQVKNAERYIKDCIESILNQSYPDFSLLVINDQSCDHTEDIILSYKDPRINLIQGRSGYINNLNYGIQLADCEYIARMDGDDIMHPSRLERQLTIMEEEHVDLCGTWMNIFGNETYLAGKESGIIDDKLNKFFEGNFLYHPTIMFRKAFLTAHHLQYEQYFPTEDYKLWSEIAKKNGVIYVIPEPLLNYRRSNGQLSIAHRDEMSRQEWRIRNEIGAFLQTV